MQKTQHSVFSPSVSASPIHLPHQRKARGYGKTAKIITKIRIQKGSLLQRELSPKVTEGERMSIRQNAISKTYAENSTLRYLSFRLGFADPPSSSEEGKGTQIKRI